MKARDHSGASPALLLLSGALAVLVGIGLVLHGQQTAAPAASERAPAAAHAAQTAAPADALVLSVAQQNLAGLVAKSLPQRHFREEVTGFGTVLDLQGLTGLVGRMATAKAGLLGAKARMAASKAAYQRAKNLYQDHFNVSAAQLQAAKAKFAEDRAAVAMVQARIGALATTAVQSWGPVLGKAVSDGSPLLSRLLAGRDVLVRVAVPSGRTVDWARPLARAIRPDGKRIGLTLVSQAASTDSRIQGESDLFAAPAERGLQPGLDVTVRLSSGRGAMGTAVPATALVWWRGRAWIYVKSGADGFRRHPVATNDPLPGGGYMVAGLGPHAAVVVKGAQTLLSREVLGGNPAQAGDAD